MWHRGQTQSPDLKNVHSWAEHPLTHINNEPIWRSILHPSRVLYICFGLAHNLDHMGWMSGSNQPRMDEIYRIRRMQHSGKFLSFFDFKKPPLPSPFIQYSTAHKTSVRQTIHPAKTVSSSVIDQLGGSYDKEKPKVQGLSLSRTNIHPQWSKANYFSRFGRYFVYYYVWFGLLSLLTG